MRTLLWLTALTACAAIPSVADGQWYGSVDFMIATRSLPTNVFQRSISGTTTATQTVASQTTLSIENLGCVGGGQATIGFRPDIVGVEGSFLITDQWQFYDNVYSLNGTLASPFTPVGSAPVAAVDRNTFASVAYSTDFQSAELNLTWLVYGDECGQAVCKFGIREISVDEELDYFSSNDSVSPATTNSLSFVTSNLLIGPQLGLQGSANRLGGMIGVNCLVGIAFNQIDRTEVFNAVPSAFDSTEGSFFGELAIEYAFQPRPDLAIRIGYKGLGLSNIALGLDDPRLTTASTSSVWYSMPYLGVVWSY